MRKDKLMNNYIQKKQKIPFNLEQNIKIQVKI